MVDTCVTVDRSTEGMNVLSRLHFRSSLSFRSISQFLSTFCPANSEAKNNIDLWKPSIKGKDRSYGGQRLHPDTNNGGPHILVGTPKS